MPRNEGVWIYLAQRVRIPVWILNQDKKVSVLVRWVGKRRFRILLIRGGEACFVPGGSVEVRMPNSTEFRVAFGKGKVFKTVDCASREERRNFLFCERCLSNTGQIVSSRPGLLGRPTDVDVRCSECPNAWSSRRV
jgi:hypothetical protein